jgi:adenosylcobinamide kinase/adenosylcobinamide-phosphate guanylyltransferase
MISRDLTFIVGGARSGKSAHAERLAATSGLPVTYIATARVTGDAEIAERIAHHRARRPAHWALAEAPLDLAGALDAAAAPGHCVLIDCLTLWLANLLCPAGSDAPLPGWQARLDAFATACERARGTVLVVSNEIGMGVVPMGAATRLYVDELGVLHQRIAALGAERIPTLGQPFDPHVAEAVDTVPVGDASQDGMVVQEIRAGYRVGARVLRPARVRVGKVARA